MLTRFEEFISDFALGLHRQSNLILDYVGIHIRMSSLSSWAAKEQAYADLYGTHWLSRLWCRHIRPQLKPGQQAAIEARYERLGQKVKQEFMLAVLEKGLEIGRSYYDNHRQVPAYR